MATKEEVIEANYFLRDYTTEDVSVFMTGTVAYYFFHETLIGVREEEKRLAYFVDFKRLKEDTALMPPTIEGISESDIQDAINEIDQSGEKLELLPQREVAMIAKRFMLEEASKMMDRELGGTTAG